MGATTDQNLIAEKTTFVVHHNFFSDLVMVKRFSDIMAIFVHKSLSSVLI